MVAGIRERWYSGEYDRQYGGTNTERNQRFGNCDSALFRIGVRILARLPAKPLKNEL